VTHETTWLADLLFPDQGWRTDIIGRARALVAAGRDVPTLIGLVVTGDDAQVAQLGGSRLDIGTREAIAERLRSVQDENAERLAFIARLVVEGGVHEAGSLVVVEVRGRSVAFHSVRYEEVDE
jgi:hypothetical protein